MVDSSGEGMVCMSLELGPRRKGLRLGRDLFSWDAAGMVDFGSFDFRLMTVPNRRRPPKALRFS